MKIPAYNEVENQTRRWQVPPYHVNPEDPAQRKFKEEHAGLRLYENGLVEIDPHVYRNPRLRGVLSSQYDLHFWNPFETRSLEYFTPEGKPVKKSWIQRGYFIYDARHKMVVQTPARLYGEHARLVSDTPIRIAEYQKGLADKFKAKHKELFAFAVSFAALEDPSKQHYWWGWQHAQELREGRLPSMKGLERRLKNPEVQSFLRWLAHMQQNNNQLEYFIHKEVRVRYEVPFLYYKERNDGDASSRATG